MKPISENIIGHVFILAPKARLLCHLGGSVGLTDSGVLGGSFSLSSSSSNTMGFSTGPSIEKLSNVVGEKGVSMPGLNTASMSNCEFSCVELYVFEIGYLIAASIQVLSPHTGEYFVSHLHCSFLVLSDWYSWQMIIQEIYL